MRCMFHDNIFPLRDPCFIWSFKIASNLANVFIIAKNFPYHHRHQMQVSHDLCAPVMQFLVPHTILLHCLEYHFQNVNITFIVRFSFFCHDLLLELGVQKSFKKTPPFRMPFDGIRYHHVQQFFLI